MLDWPTILAEHGPSVWQTVYRLLNHHADAQDCYQETFVSAWRLAARHPVDDWRSVLTTLATRKAIDRLRHRYRIRVRSLEIDRVPEPATEADCPAQQAQASELMDCVRTELPKLPKKQADVFWLSCVEGLSHQQIGDMMQVSQGEVRVLLHRARARLRDGLRSANVATKENDDD